MGSASTFKEISLIEGNIWCHKEHFKEVSDFKEFLRKFSENIFVQILAMSCLGSITQYHSYRSKITLWLCPVRCSCHPIHLCASHTSLKLPKSLEDLCRNIYILMLAYRLHRPSLRMCKAYSF